MKRIMKEQKWKKVFLTFLVSVLAFSSALAQTGANIEVKGIVKDADGEPLIGATVALKGSTTHAVMTDLDGHYTISVPDDNILVFSSIGFKPQEHAVNGKTTINIVMQEDAILLDDVMVIGYATGSKHNVSGSIQKISKKDMNVGVVNTPLDALKGKVAGVNIQRVGGDPTSAPSIRIRGTTSLTGGNDPLVVIDGVFGDLNMLNSLSPSDIESFTILKDAAETAQYGSRGASGVIVVSTAKGKYGRSTLSYDGTFGVETVYKNMKMLSGDGFRHAVNDLGIANYVDGGANTNFLKKMQQTGYTQNHKIAFGGGTEESNYRASLGVIDSKGIIKNNWMQNYTAKIDLTQFFFEKKLKMEMGIFGSKRKQRYVNDYHKTFYSAVGFNPTLPSTQNEDGSWPEDVNANEVQNPLGRLTINDHEENAYVVTNMRLTWNVLEGLQASAFGSYTYNNKENSKYIPRTIEAGRGDKGSAYRGEARGDVMLGSFQLNYKKTINKHAFDILGLIEGQQYKYWGWSGESKGFATDYFDTNNLEAGSIVFKKPNKSYKNKYELLSFLGRFNYVYNEKYIATVNLRADGSSKLGDNEKWGFFPSASLAWNMEQENFIRDLSFFERLKLRAGYGVTGNQDAIEPYNSLLLRKPDGLSAIYTRNENPDLKWETKKMFNAGFDATFLKGMLDLTFDGYYSKTTNMLYTYDVAVPPFAYPSLLANVGAMENSGIEIAVTVKPIRTKDMDLSIGVNGSYQKNKLISLDGTFRGQPLTTKTYMDIAGVSGAGMIGGDNKVVYNLVGHPIGSFFLPKSNGLIDDGLGSYTYNRLDMDGDGVANMEPDKGDRYIAGQAMPKFYLGANLNFRYKEFDIQCQMNGAFGHKIFNGTSLTYMNMTNFPTYNVMPKAPKMNIRDNKVSDYWLEKGDYLNIAYVTLGYNVNTASFNKWVKSLRITASVNNLHTFTNYKGLSPMINSNTMGDDIGVDDKRFYPLSRTYSIGVNINF